MRKLGATVIAAMLSLIATTSNAAQPARPWWQTSVIYEIYPRSFGDSNGDGMGDLKGITQYLDYLHWLGVGAIWLAPVYPSPQVDFGYDVSDYEAIDWQYGTMEDFTRLLKAAQPYGIRVIMDLVLNHTSDRHKWFVESSASRNNSKADWYVWNDGLAADAPNIGVVQRGNVHEGRVPPNNWTSVFGGSAWQWVPARHQFYYHRYYKEQPDLNWRNSAVEKAMFDVMRFWFDRGVAGFRIDAVGAMFEDPKLPNEPESGGLDAFGLPALTHVYTTGLPELHDVMRRMRQLTDSYPGNRVLIGETNVPTIESLAAWYGSARGPELHLAMDMPLGMANNARYTPTYFRPLLEAEQNGLHGEMPLIVFDNHDRPRSMDRYADGVHDTAIAKGIATILLTSRAVAMTYYGAEIGMHTRTPTRVEDVRDPVGIAGWPKNKGRDGERTPMQWNAAAQAGFSNSSVTWLPIDPAYTTINVDVERADPDSLLNWYRKLTLLRTHVAALRDGDMTMIAHDNANVLAWQRTAPDGSRVAVVVNMTDSTQRLSLPAAVGKTLAATNGVVAKGSSVELQPFAIWVGGLKR